MPDQRINSTGARARLLAALPVSERRMKVAGISTALVEAGDGPPVVLLHGPAAHAAHWMRVIPSLSRTFRVIAPDLPHHGASEAPDDELDAPRVLEWLGELVERTCPTPPALVGHLVGGSIAAGFASSRSAKLRGLVLIDTFGLRPLAPDPEFGAAIAAFLETPSVASHRGLWRYCARDFGRVERDLGASWQDYEEYTLERAQGPGVQTGSRLLLRLFGAQLDPERLGSIAVPTTLIWGRHDLATPLSVAEAASRRYGWPLHVIDDANDDPPFEQPEALVSVLRAVLASKP